MTTTRDLQALLREHLGSEHITVRREGSEVCVIHVAPGIEPVTVITSGASRPREGVGAVAAGSDIFHTLAHGLRNAVPGLGRKPMGVTDEEYEAIATAYIAPPEESA